MEVDDSIFEQKYSLNHGQQIRCCSCGSVNVFNFHKCSRKGSRSVCQKWLCDWTCVARLE